jgi:hypothetical protein
VIQPYSTITLTAPIAAKSASATWALAGLWGMSFMGRAALPGMASTYVRLSIVGGQRLCNLGGCRPAPRRAVELGSVVIAALLSVSG